MFFSSLHRPNEAYETDLLNVFAFMAGAESAHSMWPVRIQRYRKTSIRSVRLDTAILQLLPALRLGE